MSDIDYNPNTNLMSLSSDVWNSCGDCTTNANISTSGWDTGDWWQTYCARRSTIGPVYADYVNYKIRLKLSEVDTLRRACKDNDKLKEVLKKVTPFIEVEVDL